MKDYLRGFGVSRNWLTSFGADGAVREAMFALFARVQIAGHGQRLRNYCSYCMLQGQKM